MTEITDTPVADTETEPDTETPRRTRTGRSGGHSHARRGSGAPKGGLLGWLAGRSGGVRAAIIIGAVVVLLLLVVVGVEVGFSTGRVHPGVSVAGVAVGGMTQQEAAIAIESGIAPLLAEPVAVTASGQEWQVTAAQVGASVDASALASQAYSIGRGDDVLAALGARAGAWFGRERLALAVGADESLMSAFLLDATQAVGTPPVDASVDVSGTSVTLVPPKEGTGIDTGAARTAILTAFGSDQRSVTLDLTTRAAAISEDGARAAYDVARQMVSAPCTLTYDKKKWDVPAATIGGWLAFRPAADPTSSVSTSATVLECYLDSAEVSATVVPLVKEIGKLAKDATFKVSSGKVSIVPSQDGLGLDAEDLATTLLQTLGGTGQRVVALPMKRVEAAMTTEKARTLGITERLSTFTTTYASSNKPRVNNIHLLADALDGTLLAPGQVFSFNETIGQRTAEKGYQEANAIVNGKLVPQLGGGICQIGSTIFNTVFFSGFPVTERHNHSIYISHYPKGRDATVSWGGPDFKFQNDSNTWVLVSTAYTNSSVTVSLYGTDPGYKVTYQTGAFTNMVPYSVREIKDPKLPKGTKIVDEKGTSGRSIIVTRIVKKDGKTIRTDTFKSTYKATEEVVRVGTKIVPSTPATTTP
ncbi:MAG: VanW family [Actinobacteria bacterium]|nr:MAG: VanW family [Actinomycetota bacterium]